MAIEPRTMPTGTGDGYERIMGRWSRVLSGPFLDFAGVADVGQILDAGCGTGALSAEILRRSQTARVIGVDLAPAYIDYATAALGGPRARFEVGDLTSLPFENETFDQVFSSLVLHFISPVEAAIGEFVRVAKPGATVSANVWDSRSGLVFQRMFLDTAAVIDPKANEMRKQAAIRPLSRPGELSEAWKALGLANVRATELHIRTEFESFDEYWAPYDGMDGTLAGYMRTVAPEMRDRIKEAVRAAYLDGGEDGFRSYTATAFAASGIKPG